MATQRKPPQFDRCQYSGCGKFFTGVWRSNKTYCDEVCRTAASKQRRGEAISPRGAHWQSERFALHDRLSRRCARLHDLERECQWRKMWPDMYDPDDTKGLRAERDDLIDGDPYGRQRAERRYTERFMAQRGKYQSWDGEVRKWPVAWDESPAIVPVPEPDPEPSGVKVQMVHFTRDRPGGITATITVAVESAWAHERLGWHRLNDQPS